MRMSNYTPGVVVSFDQATAIARVRFPGLSDGADDLPEAMLSYPIGDKSEHTSIRILPGDRVWLDFVGGDPRYPIITGFRPKETDNAIDWRRLHHRNIELTADADMVFEAKSGVLTIKAGTRVTVQAPAIVLDGPTTVKGALTYESGISGSGGATNNGKDVGSTHTHGGVDTGGGTSGPPT